MFLFVLWSLSFGVGVFHDFSLLEREREKERSILRQYAWVWVCGGHLKRRWHVAPSTGRLSCGLDGVSTDLAAMSNSWNSLLYTIMSTLAVFDFEASF